MPSDSLTNLMGKFSKLSFCIPSFLEIEIRPFIDCLNNDFFAPPPSEQDEGDITI